jgi:hypothetical protein
MLKRLVCRPRRLSIHFKKEQPHMSIALRNKQLLALVILAFLTVLAISFVLLSAVGHINILHMVGTLLSPLYSYGRG